MPVSVAVPAVAFTFVSVSQVGRPDGALTVRLAPAAIGVEAERARRARYWHVPPRPA